MLVLQTKENHWRRNLAWFIALVLLVSGAYVLVVTFAPASSNSILTGRPENSTLQKLEKPPGTNSDRLYIPQINVDVAIVKGNNANVLEQGAWHRKPENGDPEKGGNFVLSAHRFVMSFTPQGTAEKSPFYNIDKLAPKDQIYVDYQGKRYKYTIEKKYSVPPDASKIEAPSDSAKLTLYSCTLEGSANGRDVIEAVPIEPETADLDS
jgi:sortase A